MAISQAVAQVKSDGVAIQYVDPTSAFAGHALCDSGDAWVQPFSVLDQRSSYHPTAVGQQTYATLISQCLAGKLEC